MFDTAVFDMDGTLLDTLEDLADSANHTLEVLGYPPVSTDMVRMAVGNGAGGLMARILPKGRDDPAFEQAVRLHNAYYTDHCNLKTAPYRGITGVLEEMKARGVRMAIVSNKGDAAVKRLNSQYFSKQITAAVGERAGIRKKPAPDTVLEAMRQLGKGREQTVYIGDSEVDFETAKQAGLPCILVSWGFRGRSFLEDHFHPRFLIDRPEELLPFFIS